MTATTTGKVTAAMMQRALYLHFATRWAVLFEVSSRPDPIDPDVHARYLRGEISWMDMRATARQARRIDVLLLRRSGKTNPEYRQQPADGPPVTTLVPVAALFDLPQALPQALSMPERRKPEPGDDGGIERFAIEIKVSRPDFQQDVANPDKQEPWRELAHRHAYAVPAGMVARHEVPAGSGLIEVRFGADGRGSCKFARNAPHAETATPLPLTNILDLAWRCSRAEALTRGVTQPVYGVDGHDVAEMRARLADLEHKLELASNDVQRQRERADKWRKRFGACTPPPCSTCGKPLKPTRASRSAYSGGYTEWDHCAEEDHAMCLVLRTAQAMERAERDGTRFSEYLVPSPEPADPDDEKPNLAGKPG